MKTLIDIPEKIIKQLAEICAKESISRAEAIRRAITLFLAESPHCLPKDASFGLWKGRGVDSLAYEKKLRKDWEKK
ncbi:MAG: CopG family transcriptional regulator [Deltaproteobacteria bacterium]|nr:CopG family transcriptional regulator [Deltaproteobacteria bacterium]